MSSTPGENTPFPEGLYLHHGFYIATDTAAWAEVVAREKLSLEVLDSLSHWLGKPVYLKAVDSKRVDKHHKEVLFRGRSQADMIAATLGSRGEVSARERLEVNFQDAPIVKLVNSLLEEAINRGASDVHIEPYESEMVTRFRIHGRLIDSLKSPPHYFEAVSSRIKYLARLDITQKMLPQDGKAQVEVAGQSLDLRVSTIPTKVGESIVIRILRKNVAYLDLDLLGLEAQTVKAIGALLKRPNGLILATGPTGSGKSTTLYAMLKRLHTKEVKILTVEDPVEYQMEGINQVEVNLAQGITFANILRHALRHDPDVLMVGEIRDEETARMTIQASLTGHLVLSSLHTQDSVTALTRLLDLGIEPYLVASSLRAVLAQRLIRRLCPDCKKPAGDKKPTSAKSRTPAPKKRPSPPMGRMVAVGCPACQGTGFIGRIAIVEYLEIDKTIANLMGEPNPEPRIKAHLAKNKFRTLNQVALRQVELGETTMEEVAPYLAAGESSP